MAEAEKSATEKAAAKGDIASQFQVVADEAATRAPEKGRAKGDLTQGKAWQTEHRVGNEKGVITTFDVKTFEYDTKDLGEYQIEKNRAEALDKATAYINDQRQVAQHDFANDKPATEQDQPRAPRIY